MNILENMRDRGRPPVILLDKDILIEFYPYRSMRSTIRDRDGVYKIRLTDTLQDAPDEVIWSISSILIYRIHGRKAPLDVSRPYAEYVRTDQMRRRHSSLRSSRGGKRMLPAQGSAYDLEAVFDELNSEHFGGTIDRPLLGWSLKQTFARFGHFDPDHYSITISRTLDNRKVPRYVLDYIVMHEILHILHPPKISGSRRYYHHKEFKRAEGSIPQKDRALNWLKEFSKRARKRG